MTYSIARIAKWRYVHGVNEPIAPLAPPHAEHLELAAIRAITERPALTQRQLALELGVSVGRAHYCLRALIAKGLVKAKNYRNSQHKAAYLYLLTPRGIVEKGAMTRRFLERKLKEYDALAAEIERLRSESLTDSSGR